MKEVKKQHMSICKYSIAEKQQQQLPAVETAGSMDNCSFYISCPIYILATCAMFTRASKKRPRHTSSFCLIVLYAS